MNNNISGMLAQLLKGKLSEPVYFKAIQGSDGSLVVEQVRFLRTEQLAMLVGLEERTIRGWVAKGQIPYHKPPGSSAILFELNEVIKWIEGGELDSDKRTEVA